MSILDTIAKRIGYERRKPTAMEREYASATVWPGQQYNYWNTDVEVEEAWRRQAQFVALCGLRKATVCADQAIRLFTRKGTFQTPKKRKELGVRPVTKRSRAYLCSGDRGAGVKVAKFAEQGELEEVTNHPALDLLHNPNRWTYCTEFFRTIYYHLDYAGNFYAQHDGENGKPPTTLILMTPQYTRVVPSAETFIAEYQYGQYHAHQQILMPDEVLHLRQMPNPARPWIGRPTIWPMLMEADLDSATTVGELAMQRNGARPDYALMLPPEAGPEQIKQATEKVNADHRGPQQRGKFMVTNAVGIEPFQFTPREMEAPLLKKDCVQRILACEGVPESEIFMNDAHEASARTGSVQFLRNTIRSQINMVGEFLTAGYLPLFDVGDGEMILAYDDPVPVDEAATTTAVVSQYTSGIITKNEARDELGLDPVDDGDDFKADPALITAETRANEPDAKDDRDPQKDKSLRVRKDDRRTTLPDADARTVAKLERAVKGWIKSIAAFLVEEATGIVSLAGFRPEFERLVAPFIADLYEDGFQEVAEGVPFTPYAEAEKYAERHVIKLAQAETDTIQADLQDAISTSVANGQTISDATGNVAKALNDESGYRAERIARTESSRSLQEGMRAEWKAQGITKVYWELAPNACPLCTALAAKTNAGGGTPIDQVILPVGGSVTYGDYTYTNKYLPLTTAQGHPSCRCTLRPVIA